MNILRSFVRNGNGNIKTFHIPGSRGTAAESINPEGVITGIYFYSDYITHGSSATATETSPPLMSRARHPPTLSALTQRG